MNRAFFLLNRRSGDNAPVPIPREVVASAALAVLWAVVETARFVAEAHVAGEPLRECFRSLISEESYRLFPLLVAFLMLTGSWVARWLALFQMLFIPAIVLGVLLTLKMQGHITVSTADIPGILPQLGWDIIRECWPSFLLGIPVVALAFSSRARQYTAACKELYKRPDTVSG